ncbi:MAG: protease modulator HflC [Beijerinckiaceae bacterium]|jgi:membrane protease subunit HflC|nr:protease modulator HflC [Beijerinckiaceae bacterium]
MIRSALGFAAAAVVVIGGASMFSVDQTEQAIVTQFGQPVRVITQPGLNFKIPFIQQVISLERRILDLESASIEAITSDQKRLVVDAFARYRIENPLRYFQATAGSTIRGNQQLGTYMDAALRRVVGESTFQLLVKDDRGGLMAKIRDQVNGEAAALGVAIVDIRIRRADLPDQNSQAVFRRMQTERQREAAELRAQGVEISDRIKAQADRTVTVTRAEADRIAREALGRGEAERTRLLAEAHMRNTEFFAFYRSLQAYETGLKSGDTRMVITPDSEFFKYLNNPTGKPAAPK